MAAQAFGLGAAVITLPARGGLGPDMLEPFRDRLSGRRESVRRGHPFHEAIPRNFGGLRSCGHFRRRSLGDRSSYDCKRGEERSRIEALPVDKTTWNALRREFFVNRVPRFLRANWR